MRAGCNVGGRDYTVTAPGLLEPGQEVVFEFPATVRVEKDVLTPVTVWVESDKAPVGRGWEKTARW